MVFISAKYEDYAYARRVADALKEQGIAYFFAPETLPASGRADFKDVIDETIVDCEHMVVVGSSSENIKSPFVKSEWGAFDSEKRAGRKTGNIVTVRCAGLPIADLPLALRNNQTLVLESELALLAAYVGTHRGQAGVLDASGASTAVSPTGKAAVPADRAAVPAPVSRRTQMYMIGGILLLILLLELIMEWLHRS